MNEKSQWKKGFKVIEKPKDPKGKIYPSKFKEKTKWVAEK